MIGESFPTSSIIFSLIPVSLMNFSISSDFSPSIGFFPARVSINVVEEFFAHFFLNANLLAVGKKIL
jgi:hypothetical protein